MCFKRIPKIIKTNLNITSNNLITCHFMKKRKIYLDTKINIPRNFVFIIALNNKALDILTEDNTIINLKSLPTSTRKLSLYNLNDKKKRKRFFQADTYFVNLNLFENFKWETIEFPELEDKQYGEYKTACFGDIAFKIQHPSQFLNYILSELNTNTLLVEKSEQSLKSYINSKMTKIINRLNPLAFDLYLKSKTILKELYERLSKDLNEIGVELYSISLTETRFPHKILTELKSLKEKPLKESEWTKDTKEISDTVTQETVSKNMFVTITPTGLRVPFFKECMAPYFFDEDGFSQDFIEKDSKVSQSEKQSVWKGIDEKIAEKKSKQLVDLDNIDD